jgi:hypothetical protein
MTEVIQRLPQAERLSVPRAGRTLLLNTRKWGGPILEAHQKLKQTLQGAFDGAQCLRLYKDNYAFLNYSHSFNLTSDVASSLCSSALILNWLLGRATNILPAEASLYEAEQWYCGRFSAPPAVSGELGVDLQEAVLLPLRGLSFDDRFKDILPYAAEVFETSDEILKAFGTSRKAKKAAGIFYTPSDVSDFVADYALSLREDSSTGKGAIQYNWLDPACGTGCFLLSVLYLVAGRNNLKSGSEALSYASNRLFGIDISPTALQSAAYILTLACLDESSAQVINLQEYLYRLGKHLSVCDSTDINNIEALTSLTPELKRGADFVISNPPYAKGVTKSAGIQPPLFAVSPSTPQETQNVYPSFVRMLSTLSDLECGAGGMVVPLSLTYNTRREYQTVRQQMWEGGKWLLANFDRTPDSLFGDDVKTRNTIVFFKRNEEEQSVFTTDLIRWSSRSREEVFSDLHFAKIHPSFRSRIIPKAGSESGQQLLKMLLEKPASYMGNAISRLNGLSSEAEGLLRCLGTAYNWLPFEIVLDASGADDSAVMSKYRYWAAKSKGEAFTAFAILQSRLAYWLWRVCGDGFHLTDQFIATLPFSPYSFSLTVQNRLQELGATLWKEMLGNKVVSSNAGVVSVSYCPYVSERTLDMIDMLVIQELGLPSSANTYFKEFIARTVVAGREAEIHTNPALRKWMVKEKQNERSVA